MKNIIYCYSKCSTCHKALKWLDNHNINYDLKDIYNNHPNYEEMKKIVESNNIDINKYFNTSGILYRELNLKEKLKSMNFEEKLKLLVSDGRLIKRPLMLTNDKVLVGFNEKNWNNLLN